MRILLLCSAFDVRGRSRPPARQVDRGFCWSDPTEQVRRRIRAADGSPVVLATLCGVPVRAFDAHREVLPLGDRGEPGTVAARCRGAVRVHPGDGVGHRTEGIR